MDDLILNRYKAIDVAGKGGFGTVIVAWDTRMRRKVAIKQIALAHNKNQYTSQTIRNSAATQIIDNTKNNNITQNVNKKNSGKSVDESGEHWEENIPGLSEARTAAMIQDANIVTVHDFELEDNNAYIIMEYVEGITLTQFLNKHGDQMTLDMLTCIFNGVSHALEVAHSEGVLHLDIKPDNVLIDNKGKVKVTDFGLATLADEFGYGTADAGTLGYMPVEQMRRQALDVRCDQWALACITYEMLCGNNPFDANDLTTAISKIENSKLISPSSCWEDIEPELDQVIFKALSSDANNRYLSIKDFYQDLSKYLSNPRAGQRQLSALLKEGQEVDIEKDIQKNKFSALEKLTNKTAKNILGRVFAVIGAFPVVMLSCLNIEFFGGVQPNMFFFIAVLVLLIIVGIWPPLGITTAIASLCVALILSGNYILAGILMLIAILWCVYNFKSSLANSNSLLSFPLFGSFGFAQFSPFFTGLFVNVKDTIINCFYGFVICFILACLGSNSLVGWQPFDFAIFSNGISTYGTIQNVALDLLMQLPIWIWCISWIATGVVVSVCFQLKQRSIHIIGSIAGLIIMIVGICIAHYFSSGQISWQPQGWEILPTVTAGIISVVLSAFMPNRIKE